MKKTLKLYCIILATITIFLLACNDQVVDTIVEDQIILEATLQKNVKLINNANEAGKITLTGIIAKDKINDSIIYIDDEIGVKALNCKTQKFVYWEVKYFAPQAGKTLSIWPGNGIDISTYHTKWGFNSIIVSLNQSAFDTAKNNGYPEDNIIASLPWYQSVDYIKNQISVVHSELYYLDEPLDQYRFTKQEILEIANHISSLYPASKLLLGSFNNPNGFYLPYVESFWHAYNYILANNSNTFMMCDKYYGDQRYMWGEFKTDYGASNIYGHFIHSRKDYEDYNELLLKANSLGVSKINFFIGDDGWTDKTFGFCNYAWQKGFLRRFSQKVEVWYECTDYSCETCQSDEGNWILDRTIYGVMREDLL